MHLIIGAIIGGWLGFNDRANQQRLAQGIRPTWSQRHPILYEGGMLLWVFTLVIGGIIGLAWIASLSWWLALAVVIAAAGWFATSSYQRAERRWDPYQQQMIVTRDEDIPRYDEDWDRRF
jgi:hypothetical protein